MALGNSEMTEKVIVIAPLTRCLNSHGGLPSNVKFIQFAVTSKRAEQPPEVCISQKKKKKKCQQQREENVFP